MSKRSNLTPLVLPFSLKLTYFAGQLGWSIASFGVMNLLFYYFDANIIDGERMFPALLPSIGILAFIAAISRLFDAVTDPIIAAMSDRSNHRWGRRRLFMAIGGLPFIVLSVLVFIMPTATPSWFNGVWLIVAVLLFYLFMTIYITPYFALIAELGHDAKGRLSLSTGVAVAWALGFLVGNSVYVFQGLFEQGGRSSVQSLQITLVIFALVALVLVYLPVFFIDEKKYCYPHKSDLSTWQALKSCFGNVHFRKFVAADFSYFVAMTFIQTGISFYVIMLLGAQKELATTFMTVLFLASFLLYIPVAALASRFGKKPILLLAFCLMIIGTSLLMCWGILPFSQTTVLVLTLLFMVLPMSAFSFLFYAVIGDIAEADGKASGQYKEGMFFGSRTFMSKSGTAVSMAVFPLVSHFSASGTVSTDVTELGIRLTLVFAIAFLIMGALLFSRYDEKDVSLQLQSRS